MSALLLKSFIIGSSAPIFLPILYRVSKLPEDRYNYNYKDYSVIAPVFYGSVSVLVLLLTKYLKSYLPGANMALFYSILIVAIISIIHIIYVEKIVHPYNFTKERDWYRWMAQIIVFYSTSYLFMYNFHKLFEF